MIESAFCAASMAAFSDSVLPSSSPSVIRMIALRPTSFDSMSFELAINRVVENRAALMVHGRHRPGINPREARVQLQLIQPVLQQPRRPGNILQQIPNPPRS